MEIYADESYPLPLSTTVPNPLSRDTVLICPAYRITSAFYFPSIRQYSAIEIPRRTVLMYMYRKKEKKRSRYLVMQSTTRRG